jgi:hypothetical protein
MTLPPACSRLHSTFIRRSSSISPIAIGVYDDQHEHALTAAAVTAAAGATADITHDVSQINGYQGLFLRGSCAFCDTTIVIMEFSLI